MSTFQSITDKLNEVFDSEAAAGADLVFQFNLDGGDDFNITVKDNACNFEAGTAEEPSIALTMKAETMDSLMDGSLDGMKAFMMGKIRTKGNIMNADKFAKFFPAPSA